MKPQRCPTCHRRIRRSSDANARYWALLHEIAAKLRPHGQSFSVDQYHAYYKTRFLGADDVALPNGEVLTIPRSSAELDASEFSDYLDRVEADAAERGVFMADREGT